METTFQTVSEASIDAKMSKLQGVKVEMGEEIVSCSNRIRQLVNEVESAGLQVLEIEREGLLVI